MKLKTQVLAFGLAGVLLAGLAGGIGLLATARLGDAIEQALQASAALQASQEADMMHDAVRGDAQLALLGALESAPDRIAEAGRNLGDHTRTFEQALDKLGGLPLSEPSRRALVAVRPVVTRYLQAAATVVTSSRTDAQAAQKAMPGLLAAFGELEKELGALSDQIESDGEELTTRANAGAGQAQWAIGLALAVATGVMVLLALWLARHMAQPMGHAVEVADRMAQGDLTADIAPTGNEETQRLLVSMARMRSNFADIVRRVQGNADAVANASGEIAQGNQDLSSRTEEQSGALQRTSSTMEQLGANVRQNADNARQASELAHGASDVARRGGDTMGRVVATMQGIDGSSKKIADIIGVIDGIAFQTNILALNAAVEAARAGEQGRGFAVVAGEVRALAQRSASAAREIKTLITASVQQVEQGSALVGQAGSTMAEIVAAIGRVSTIVEEISRASAEQSGGVSEVGQAVAQMDQTTQQNAALVEQSAAAADSLSRQAQELVQAVSAFRLAHA